jgi:hypothetical protein
MKACSELTKATCKIRSKHQDPSCRCKYDDKNAKCVKEESTHKSAPSPQKAKNTPNPEPTPQTKNNTQTRGKPTKACSEITKAYCYVRARNPDPTRRCKYDTKKKKCVDV